MGKLFSLRSKKPWPFHQSIDCEPPIFETVGLLALKAIVQRSIAFMNGFEICCD